MWRSKDKLRKINVIVTDDTALRQKGDNNTINDNEDASPFDQPCPPARHQEPEASSSSSTRNKNTSSPTKRKTKAKKEISAEQSLFGDFF